MAADIQARALFPLVIGPVDGILTALTLAAGRILTPDQPIDISLALRIALAASLSGGFVFFVAEYARLRGELVHAARHLNLASTGRLATSRLGQEVLRESVLGTVIAAATGFGGALLPLILGPVFSTILPGFLASWQILVESRVNTKVMEARRGDYPARSGLRRLAARRDACRYRGG